MQHYEDNYNFFIKNPRIYMDIEIDRESLGKIIKQFEAMEVAFNDEGRNEFGHKMWQSSYGGSLWAKIAEILKTLSEEYLKFLDSEPYSEERKKHINNCLVYMNIFDGLAHNTGSIYNKLISIESGNRKYEDFERDSNEINELMNLKELEDPIEVYKKLEDKIDMKLPYKDYIENIRSKKDYYDKDLKKIERDLESISSRKGIRRNLPYIIGDIEAVKRDINSEVNNFFDKIKETKDTESYLREIAKFHYEVKSYVHVIEYKFKAAAFIGIKENEFTKEYFNNIRDMISNVEDLFYNLLVDINKYNNWGMVVELGPEVSIMEKDRVNNIINTFRRDLFKVLDKYVNYIKSV
jgi:hypothetical protein